MALVFSFVQHRALSRTYSDKLDLGKVHFVDKPSESFRSHTLPCSTKPIFDNTQEETKSLESLFRLIEFGPNVA